MELTELSLAPTHQFLVEKSTYSSSSESENNISSSSSSSSRKTKFFSNNHLMIKTTSNRLPAMPTQTSVDLHVKDPLPLDWEQCLDLESGRMYYLNRKTLRKSWNWPKDQKLDLELNISPLSDHHHHQCIITSSNNNSSSLEEDHHYYSSKTKDCHDHHQSSSPSTNSNNNNNNNSNNHNNNNTVAMVCLNCHLLVILSKSFPSCPNCKYVHSLPTTPQPKIPPLSTTNKSLNTLSLLN